MAPEPGSHRSPTVVMYTTARDWFDRLKAAGGWVRIDAAQITPSPKTPLTNETEDIWAELQGDQNHQRYVEVMAMLRQAAGPIDGYQDV